ncbi:sensor domain-containing diguanylate cyclase [Rhodoferax sp.]|uniref:sensor domain-containing diguanylate cyclase n=1 Tax=Rhodoferax sp. TaxID=50421 RepID=UPI0025FED689|nr:sensor domain-containing diguanylate cyclase [Rhodoferax sp.]
MQLQPSVIALVLLTALLVGGGLYAVYRRRIGHLQQRLDALLLASTDAISFEAPDGTVRSWSPKAEAMFGYTAQQMLGQTLQRLIPPDRQWEEDALLEALGTAVQTLDTVRLHQNGNLVPVSIALVALVDAKGRRTGVARVVRDTTRQQVSAELIQSMAFNDALTGLPNWRLLRDRIWRAQLNSGRQRTYFAVLYVDLDNFKAVNSVHGRTVGDQVLVEVSVRLMAAIRQNDTVARVRGDEFVVLLEDLGGKEPSAAHHVNAVADKIWDMLERDYPVGALHVRCTASIGIQLRLGGNGSVDQIIQAADAAMEQVKLGRKSVARGVFGGVR